MAVTTQTRSFHLRASEGVPTEAGPNTCTAEAFSSSQVINLRQPDEVSAWTHRLGCTEERLRLAVAAVGPELDEVCSHLGTQAPARPLNTLAGNGRAH
jgi:hypothetical protein